jgi:hypothetical protein
MTIFTAKWVYEVAGIQHERLIEADQVHVAYDARTPTIRETKGVPNPKLGVYEVPQHGVVVLGNCYDGGDSMALAFGTVYIMNCDGKTVAKYHLSKEVLIHDSIATETSFQGDEAPKFSGATSKQVMAAAG